MATAIINDNYLHDVADAIREKGGASSGMYLSEMAENVRSIPTGGGTYQAKTVSPTEAQQNVTPDTGYDALSSVTVEAARLQEKAASLQTTEQDITPDNGYYGLSKVSVPAAPSFTTQEKSATPSTSSQTITPDSGYDGLSKVTVGAAKLQEKSVTPGSSTQTVRPDSGFYGLSSVEVGAAPGANLQSKSVELTGSKQVVGPDPNYDALSQVTVPGVVGTATANDVLAAKTFSSATNPTGTTGNIPTKSASSETISSAKQYDPGYYPNAWTVTPEGSSLMTRTFAQNGTYDARTDDNVDGYSSVTVDVQVSPGGICPSRIYVSVPPTKTSYLIGDVLDLTGMVVKAVWADGTETDVTNDITTVPANGETISVPISRVNIKYTFSWTGAFATYTASQDITVPAPEEVYGVKWTYGKSPILTRTDDAAQFSNPSAAIGDGSGSSPFDNILPWSGMKRVTHPMAGEVIAIPKYYYKADVSSKSVSIQISASEFSGSYVSPAHRDRGDGKGERDIVYVGRYHCGNNYRSESGSLPAIEKTRAQFRQMIHEIDPTVWQWDYLMYQTIFMLYLVEYATWYSQNAIGAGCGAGSELYANGNTDAMQYHTGTSAAARTTYGDIQYRNIEGLWSGVRDYLDGVYSAGSKGYMIKNPALFSDNQNGLDMGNFSNESGIINDWDQMGYYSTADEFEGLIFPSDTYSANRGEYCCSTFRYSTSFTIAKAGVLVQGGTYSVQDVKSGLFFLDLSLNNASSKSTSVGSRLMILP